MSALRPGWLLAAALTLPLTACSEAEPPEAAEAGQAPAMQEGIEPLELRAADAPNVGDLFPDVTVVSDSGEAVNIRELAKKKPYTVMTLGCLT